MCEYDDSFERIESVCRSREMLLSSRIKIILYSCSALTELNAGFSVIWPAKPLKGY